MEYIDGEDLAALLRRIDHLSVPKGVELARQLCSGLASVHDAGMVHRDLKPANIMLDGRGRVRITDFGLSGLAEEFRGEDNAGTPAYMAPEQLVRCLPRLPATFTLSVSCYTKFSQESVHLRAAVFKKSWISKSATSVRRPREFRASIPLSNAQSWMPRPLPSRSAGLSL